MTPDAEASRTMDICTIVASNYVAHARVLAHSYREHHPEGRCWVLVIDDHRGRIDPADEPFELLTPAELDIEQFDRMATLYDVLELSTAVKPWLLRHLLNVRGAETLAYLDPDIVLFDRLDEIDALAREHTLVVTPHLTEPMPRDGRKPSETDILIAGSYNLGFVALHAGEASDALLDWWGERLETDCVVAPERGYFVDQRWMDFAPGLVPSVHVLRDPGYNVAYWNLPTREVARAGDGFTVNGRPLRFFHYSGFDPERPQLLSKHQNRIRVGGGSALRALCDRYAAQLLEAGYLTAKDWPYTYRSLGDGTPLDAAVRLGYRRAVEAGELPRSPFTETGARELIEWLNAPAVERGVPNVSRYLVAVHDGRADLQSAFPDIGGRDAAAYVAWGQGIGRAEVPIPDALVPGGVGNGSGRPAPGTLGVNVAGYFRSVLGVGEAARQVASALETVGVSVDPVGLVAQRSRQDQELGPAAAGGQGRHPVNLLCVNADVVNAFADDVGPEFFRDRHTIGLWWWEVSTFPERWMSAFSRLDEVWVGSRHVADALTPVSPIPIVPIVQPVVVTQPPTIERSALGLPEGFVFLFSFDYNSVFERKNPLAAIEAFAAAFAPGSGASLVIKSINHEHDEANHERLRQAAAAHPDVYLIDRYVSREERDALTASCDCYVSLHRSEGFGFTVAEAMAFGRPVISTGYSGTMDFTTTANAYLVDYDLVPIGPGVDPYPAEGEWAEPSVEHAARLMREVLEHPEEARARGDRGRHDIATRHSLAAAGRVMATRLHRIAGNFGASATQARPPGAFDPAPVRRRVSSGPDTPAHARFGAPQRFARRALLRTLKPYAVHERMVHSEIINGLDAVDRSVHALSQAQAGLAARVGGDPDRIDDLAGQVDELRNQLDRALSFMRPFGFGDADVRAEALGLAPWPQAPKRPWTPEYVERHREYVTRALDDPDLLTTLGDGDAPLPAGYGQGFDERVVEFPWTLSRDLGGRVLDAGSTLNHPHVLVRLRPRLEELDIVTLAPEANAFHFLDISYLFADLRELPFRDGTYDRVVSISTLEHVGMDNAKYGDDGPRATDAAAAGAAAMGELRRVLKRDGALYVTVPYGRADDLGWQRIFDDAALDGLVEGFKPSQQRREFFRYDEQGWRRSSADEAADAVYRDHASDPEPAADGAVAARAIACLELRP